MENRFDKWIKAVVCLAILFVTASSAQAERAAIFYPIDPVEVSGGMGICVIGVPSPCNDPQYWGDGSSDRGSSVEPGTEPGAEAGICEIGVPSPCNDPQYWGDGSSDRGSSVNPVEPGTEPVLPDPTVIVEPTDSTGQGAEAGICEIGVPSPCNDPQYWEDGSSDRGSSVETGTEPEQGKTSSGNSDTVPSTASG